MREFNEENFNLCIDEMCNNNPWNNADESTKILKVDEDKYDNEIFKKAWGWENQPDDKKGKYDIEDQFPLPINGNFRNAKYLMLYSNPATEENEIPHDVKTRLLECFKLTEKAELVIANKQWSTFYTKELSRFFRYDFDDKKNISDDQSEVSKFLNQFCFVNYCAYATGVNTFNFSDGQIQNNNNTLSLRDFESTRFVLELVKLWITHKGKENIYIVRARDRVWRNNLFAKLDLHTMYNEKTTDK